MRRGYGSLVGSFLLDGSTPQTMSPQTYIVWGKSKAVGFVWTGGFAVIANTRNDEHNRKACLGTTELHRTYCLVSLARQSGGSRERFAAVRANAEDRAANLRAIVDDLRSQGFTSVRAIAAQLNERGILTARGGSWHPTSAARLLSRLQA
jgi:hypothetical protein